MQEVAVLAEETPTRKVPQILPLVAPFLIKKNGVKALQILPKTDKGQQKI